jgi:hypothetical protein
MKDLLRVVTWTVRGREITEQRQTGDKEASLAAIIWSFRSDDYPVEAVSVNGVDYPRPGSTGGTAGASQSRAQPQASE